MFIANDGSIAFKLRQERHVLASRSLFTHGSMPLPWPWKTCIVALGYTHGAPTELAAEPPSIASGS